MAVVELLQMLANSHEQTSRETVIFLQLARRLVGSTFGLSKRSIPTPVLPASGGGGDGGGGGGESEGISLMKSLD